MTQELREWLALTLIALCCCSCERDVIDHEPSHIEYERRKVWLGVNNHGEDRGYAEVSVEHTVQGAPIYESWDHYYGKMAYAAFVIIAAIGGVVFFVKYADLRGFVITTRGHHHHHHH